MAPHRRRDERQQPTRSVQNRTILPWESKFEGCCSTEIRFNKRFVPFHVNHKFSNLDGHILGEIVVSVISLCVLTFNFYTFDITQKVSLKIPHKEHLEDVILFGKFFCMTSSFILIRPFLILWDLVFYKYIPRGKLFIFLFKSTVAIGFIFFYYFIYEIQEEIRNINHDINWIQLIFLPLLIQLAMKWLDENKETWNFGSFFSILYQAVNSCDDDSDGNTTIFGIYMSNITHSCCDNPADVRREVFTLTKEYNARITRILYFSFYYFYYSCFIPFWVTLKIFQHDYVWIFGFGITAFCTYVTVYIAFYMSARFFDACRQSANHLGYWEKTVNCDLNKSSTMLWNPDKFYKFNTFVLNNKNTYRTTRIVNAAIPDSDLHKKFYTTFASCISQEPILIVFMFVMLSFTASYYQSDLYYHCALFILILISFFATCLVIRRNHSLQYFSQLELPCIHEKIHRI